jgi:hypothetical protein
MDVELRLGDTWLTRSGDTVKLVELDHSDDVFPFEGDNNYWYTKMGRCTRTSKLDLVELVSDVEQAPKPDAALSRSLVERVALTRMNPPLDEDDLKYARAAIREVAAWLKEQDRADLASWIEQEADRG